MLNSRPARITLSIILIVYMLIVLLGPLSNPVGSEFLTRPLARLVSPVHRALFLGHGYRFFGPDPGPSHLMVYRIADDEGKVTEQHFPNRNIQPRLMYHRWFMLSETVYQELNLTMDQASYEATDAELAQQIEMLRVHGKSAIAKRIEAERKRLSTHYQNARQRIDQLIAGIAKNLLKEHRGNHIELFMQERTIPFPAGVLTGQKINDPTFLSDMRKIGEFRLDDQGQVVSVLPVASMGELPAREEPSEREPAPQGETR